MGCLRGFGLKLQFGYLSSLIRLIIYREIIRLIIYRKIIRLIIYREIIYLP